MIDILEITPPEAKVLRAIFFVENKNKKLGATQYECKELPRDIAVADSTFNNQKRKLVQKKFLFPVKARDVKPYTITTLGKYSLLKFYSSKGSKSDINVLEFVVRQIPNLHYAEIESIFHEENIINVLRNILISSIQLVHIQIEKDFSHIYRTNETLTIPFYYGNYGLTIERIYEIGPQKNEQFYKMLRDEFITKFGKKKYINFESLYYAGLLNESELKNGLFDRIIFSFYNLLLNIEETWNLIVDMDSIVKEIKKEEPELFNSKNFESGKIPGQQFAYKQIIQMQKTKKQTDKSIEIIKRNSSLKKIMENTYEEINKMKNNVNFVESSLKKIN